MITLDLKIQWHANIYSISIGHSYNDQIGLA